MNAVKQQTRTKRIGPLAIGVIAATCAIGVSAQSLPYTSRAGFYAGFGSPAVPGQAVMINRFWDGVNPPLAGGLDFFGPTSSLSPQGPANTYGTISWGCPANPSTPLACATGGALFPPPGLGYPDPWGNGNRSALRVTGGGGTMITPDPSDPNANWVDITTVEHQNFGIFGSTLSSVQVQGFLRLNPTPAHPNGVCVDNLDETCASPSLTDVTFVETVNDVCNVSPDPGNAPVNPLGSQCDDFALVSGLQLTTLPLPVGSPWNPFNQTLFVNFRLDAAAGSGALVCDGPPPFGHQPAACGNYNGVIGGKPTIIVYTAESSTNKFTIQAQLTPFPPPTRFVPQFVIGDCEYLQAPPGQAKKNPIPPDNNLREVGDVVNFWGSQWWKNNCMHNENDNGYPAFKGFAVAYNPLPTNTGPCGTWQARPGNSGHPPDTLDNVIDIIVTDRVNKDGPNLFGNVIQIVRVDRTQPPGLDNYAGNPGHQGWGTITSIQCGTDAGNAP